MEYFFGAILFLFGASIGSFIAVIENRYNTGLSFFKGRSFCFSCNTELRAKDMIPVFSFLSLKGRCRYCSSKISKDTILTEAAMGGLSLLAAVKSGLLYGVSAGFDAYVFVSYVSLMLVFGSILIISIYDIKHFIIPDDFLIAFILSSLAYIFLSFSAAEIFIHIISGIILMLPFLTLFYVSKGKWLGFGDVKYIAAIGFFLGYAGGASAVILAFWIGAAFSIIVLSLNKLKTRLPSSINNLTIKSEVPFGPFLSIGILLSFYFSVDVFQINSLLNAF